MPALLTEPEAADALHLSQRTLRKARQNGSLRYVRFGRTVRYTVLDLDDFIASAQVANDMPPPRHKVNAPRQRTGQIVPFSARQKRV